MLNLTKETILRLAVYYLLFTTFIFYYGANYVETLLPVYKYLIQLITPDFHIQGLEILQHNDNPVIQLTVQSTYSLHFELGDIPRGSSMSSSTQLNFAMQHLLIVYILLIGWSVYRQVNVIRIILLSLPVLVLLELIDIPLILVGSIKDLIYAELSPAQQHSSLWVFWMKILLNGGRQVLCILAAWITVYLETRLPSIIKAGNKIR